MVSVGYGDFSPINTLEKIFGVISMLINCGIYGYAINTIGQIVENTKIQNQYIQKSIYIIKKYMQQKNVAKEIKIKVREYLEYYWTQVQQGQEQEQEIINQLSDSLKSTLLLEANKLVLIDTPIFQKNFSSQIIGKTIGLIKEKTYNPEEYVYNQNDKGKHSIYFIEKGEVGIYQNGQFGQKLLIQTLKKGDYFGQKEFFTSQNREQTVRCNDFCVLLEINGHDFQQIVSQYSQDFQKYCNIKDSLILSNNNFIINQKCQSCGSFRHNIQNCKYLNFDKSGQNIHKLIIKYNIQTNQKQIKNFQRKTSGKYNYFSNFSQIEEDAQDYQELEENFIQEYFNYFLFSQEEQSNMENLKNQEQLSSLINDNIYIKQSYQQLASDNSNNNNQNVNKKYKCIFNSEIDSSFQPVNNSYKKQTQESYIIQQIKTEFKKLSQDLINQKESYCIQKNDQNNGSFQKNKNYIQPQKPQNINNCNMQQPQKNVKKLSLLDKRQYRRMSNNYNKKNSMVYNTQIQTIFHPNFRYNLECDNFINYECYYPHHNLDIILKGFNYLQIKQKKYMIQNIKKSFLAQYINFPITSKNQNNNVESLNQMQKSLQIKSKKHIITTKQSQSHLNQSKKSKEFIFQKNPQEKQQENNDNQDSESSLRNVKFGKTSTVDINNAEKSNSQQKIEIQKEKEKENIDITKNEQFSENQNNEQLIQYNINNINNNLLNSFTEIDNIYINSNEEHEIKDVKFNINNNKIQLQDQQFKKQIQNKQIQQQQNQQENSYTTENVNITQQGLLITSVQHNFEEN